MRTSVILASSALLLLCFPFPEGRAETETKDVSPRLTLLSFSMQTAAKQGDFITASAFFQLTAPIEVREKVFFHLARPGRSEVDVNADFFPRLSSDRWEVGEAVEAGPVNLAIPSRLDPGEYEVRAGLMEIVREETGVRYLREPYTNPDIENFVVSKLTVEEAEPVVGEERPPIVSLIDFEDEQEIMLCEPYSATVAAFREGDLPAVAVTVHPGLTYPGVILENLFSLKPALADWSLYDVLELGLQAASAERGGRVILQISDREGRQYKKEFWLTPGVPEKQMIGVFNIAGEIDVSRIGRIKIFLPGSAKEDYTFYISTLRLVSRGMPGDEPAVNFVRLEAPDRVQRGEIFKVKVYFSLNQPVFPRHKMFVHVYRQYDLKGRITGDVSLFPPVRNWPLDEEIGIESAPLLIDPEAPAGTYMVRAGLYLIAETGGEGYVKMDAWDEYTPEKLVSFEMQPASPRDYIKQPYTNTEIKDWEVGKIEVE